MRDLQGYYGTPQNEFVRVRIVTQRRDSLNRKMSKNELFRKILTRRFVTRTQHS